MLDPAFLAGAYVFIALTAYALLAGADFGGGVWDLFATGPRARAQRDTIEKAIGPIWEANHVWMIVVLVVLWTCFPVAYQRIAIALHLPLVWMLLGITLRGSAFVFRAYDTQRDDVHRRWSLVFSLSSIFTPFLLGACVGSLASGAVAEAPQQASIFAPLPLSIGTWTVCLNAWLAATYLAVEAPTPALQEDFRLRALVSGVLSGLLALVTLAWLPSQAPHLLPTDAPRALGVAFVGVTSLMGACNLVLSYRRSYRAARATAVGLTVAVFLGWGLAQFPYILPPSLTYTEAAAPSNVLWMVVGCLSVGLLGLLPAFLWMYRVFKGPQLDGGPPPFKGS